MLRKFKSKLCIEPACRKPFTPTRPGQLTCGARCETNYRWRMNCEQQWDSVQVEQPSAPHAEDWEYELGN